MKKQKYARTEPNAYRQRAERQIRQGWQAGVGSMFYTLLAVTFNEYSSYINLRYIQTPDEFLVIAVLSGLISLKFHIGALLMVVYFTVHKLILLASGRYHFASVMVIDLFLAYFYMRAARGTYLLRKPI
jgi:hypothetical protein